MRIVFYSVSVTLYGAPTSLLNLIQGLLEMDKDLKLFVVVPSEGPLVDELRKLRVTVIKIPFYKWIFKKSLYDKKRAAGPLIADLWFLKNLATKLFLNLFWLPAHLYHVWKLQTDYVYTNSSLSPMGVIVARLLNIRSVWHHRETINDQETDFFMEWNGSLGRRVLNWPDIHIHPSRFLENSYQPYVATGRSRVVYNGVEEAKRYARMDSYASRENVIGMVGRINRQKGQHEIIAALNDNRFRHFTLNLYGSGEKMYLRKMEKIAGFNVILKGFQSRECIYRDIEYLVVNAQNESFGRVVAEAYAYGVPVIGLHSGALPELIADGRTGFLFKDVEQFRGVLERISDLKKNGGYEVMSKESSNAYHQNYTVRKYAETILGILKNNRE